MPLQPFVPEMHNDAEAQTGFRAYHSIQASTSKAPQSKSIPDCYIPDWTDSAQMSQLHQHNPQIFTIRKIERKEPAEYKIQFQFTGTDWIFWFIVASLALLSWLRIAFGKIIDNTLAASVSFQASSRILRERNSLNLRISFVLNLLFAFNASIFFFQIGSHYAFLPTTMDGYWITVLGFVAIAMLYLIKEFVLRVIGFIADIAAPMSEYLNIISINNKVLGMALLPIIIGAQYAKTEVFPKEYILFVGCGIFSLFYLIRIIRGFIISLKHSVSLFYSFLYLCTLELAPMVFIYTIATSL